MNSMVAAYHETKSSVSSEKDLERRHSKELERRHSKKSLRSKSLSDQSQPSSPVEEKALFQDDKTNVVDGDPKAPASEKDPKASVKDIEQELPVSNDDQKTNAKVTHEVDVVVENEQFVDADIEHAEKQTAKDDTEKVEKQSESDAEIKEADKVKENEYTPDNTKDNDVSVNITSSEREEEQSKTDKAKSEQKEKKNVFFLARHSLDTTSLEQDQRSSLESPGGSSSIHPLLMMKNASSNAKKDDTCIEVPAPFAKYVDVSRLHDALSAEKVHLGHDHVNEEALKHALKKKDEKALKIVIRQNHWGADHEIRASLWQLLCKHLHKAHKDDTFEDFAKDIFPPVSPGGSVDDIPLPAFADYSHIECFNLSTEGLDYAKKIACVIEHTRPDVTYCPLLVPLVSLFLHYMDPGMAYNCAYSLLSEKEDTYIPQSNALSEASKFVVKDLSRKYARHCFNHIARSYSSSVETFFTDWIWWIFGDLPFPYLVRVIDCFISEGFKIFYRVVLAILITYAKYHAKKSSKPVPDVLSHLRKFCRELPITVDKLLKVAFSIKGISRKEMKKLQVKHTMYINSVRMVQAQSEQTGSRALISRSFSAAKAGAQVSLSRSFSGPIRLQQQLNSSILEMEMLYAIWTWLPTRYAVCQPLLLYTSEEHGTSLMTLYTRVENYQPTVIVIKNTENEIFGAFCSAYWRERKQSTKNLSYFGTGETFVFTLSPEKKKYDWVGLKEENIPTTANMFQAGDRHVLIVGGGNGEAILLDENLLHCRTEYCDTFANEPLCDKKDFACNVVEVYGFQ